MRAKPGATRSGIVGVHGGALKVAVAEAPERGKANDAIVRVLAEVLGVAPSEVKIVAGATSRDKSVVVDLAPDEVRRRLGAGPKR